MKLDESGPCEKPDCGRHATNTCYSCGDRICDYHSTVVSIGAGATHGRRADTMCHPFDL